MFRRFDDIFETCGWRVITMKHGKLQKAAVKKPGGKTLEDWLDNCPNADYAALTYQGGAAWRARRMAGRQEGSRVGNEGVSTCGSRCGPQHYKKKQERRIMILTT